jgi:Flp pilus assembly protein TadD
LERVIGSGDLDAAWEQFRTQAWTAAQRPEAAARMAAALEDSGQACVADYVQSTRVGLKGAMFQRAALSFRLLETLRPGEPLIRARALFCQARAEIATGKLAEAEANLRRSLEIDSNFACSYNALGVVLQRQDRTPEARAAFDRARQLTPNWALPPLQIAQLLIAGNDLARALPYLEEAARLFPKATGIQWSLARLNRVLRRPDAFLAAARATIAADPNYAPIYSELGLFHEASGNTAMAAEAYNTYLTLAPNLVDSNQVRERVQKLRRR